MIGIRMSRMMASGLDGVGKLQARLGGEGSRHPESLQLEHPGEGIGHRPVVVHDQDGPGGGVDGKVFAGAITASF